MFPAPNLTKQKLRSGDPIFGVFVPLAAPRLVELMGIAGFDYVVIDAEHAPIGFERCEEMVRAADAVGITPIVRVPDHLPKTILRYLDVGAQGIMVPQLNSVEIARQVISAVKYAPLGTRGLGPGRAAAYGQRGPLSDYAPYANDQTMIIAQLEHVDALKDLNQLLALPELDAFELGLSDLSQSLGLPGQSSHPEVLATADKFVEAVLAAGRVIGDTAGSAQEAFELLGRGYQMVDFNVVAVAMRQFKSIRAELKDVRSATVGANAST